MSPKFSPLVTVIALLVLLTGCAAPAAGPAASPPTPDPAPTAAAPAPTQASPTAVAPAPTTAPSPAPTPSVIEAQQAAVIKAMTDQHVPGLSVAIVDEKGVVWAEGFGHTDTDGKTPVTADTLFAVQSVSKMVTADVVMLAVQDGLLDLDAPVTIYLPDFTVNSIFEERPERKITIRMLLSHRAGFTHDSAVGNNNDLGHWQIEQHIKSISATWLRFPVGTGYAYSNLGPDLAAYIVGVRAGKPFAEYAAERLFKPLGMTSSTLDPLVVRQTAGRAVGHTPGLTDLPIEVPMQGAGGLWSTANDMAKFVQWHLNHGMAGGKQLLPAPLLEETYKPLNPAGAVSGYGLGTANARANDLTTLGHSGGGFGFLSDVYWHPDISLGGVLLTNSTDHNLQAKLIYYVLDAFAHDPARPYLARLAAAPTAPTGPSGCSSNDCPPAGLASQIALLARKVTDADQARWQTYAGDYRLPVFHAEVVGHIRVANGQLWIGGAGQPDIPLTEVQEGLFFTQNGEVLDLRGPDVTFRGMRLIKVTK